MFSKFQSSKKAWEMNENPFPMISHVFPPRKHDFMDWGWVFQPMPRDFWRGGMNIFLNDWLSYAEMSKPANFLEVYDPSPSQTKVSMVGIYLGG